jgi:hypothetical protein
MPGSGLEASSAAAGSDEGERRETGVLKWWFK